MSVFALPFEQQTSGQQQGDMSATLSSSPDELCATADSYGFPALPPVYETVDAGAGELPPATGDSTTSMLYRASSNAGLPWTPQSSSLHSQASAQSLGSGYSTPSMVSAPGMTTPASAHFSTAPPNTAADGGGGAWAQTTGLTPLLASFPDGGMPHAMSAPAVRPGPLRTVSGSASMPAKRERFASGLSLTSPLPVTPFSPMSASPYASQRASAAAPAKRVFHPSPASAPALDVDLTKLPLDSPQVVSSQSSKARSASMSMAAKSTLNKPPRFKPTKEQLDVLVAAYERNKNPDGPTRQGLSDQLGIRPKTLQIWFQNRRSKAREKERKLEEGKERPAPALAPPAPTYVQGGTRGIDSDALRCMMHDDRPDLIAVPVSVVAIGAWLRVLTPGTGLARPDLAVSLHAPTGQLCVYVTHAEETYRLSLHIHPQTVANVTATANPRTVMDSVAVRLTIAAGACTFNRWDGRAWGWHSDFTSRNATQGGIFELTGDREVMDPAYQTIQAMLAAYAYPTPLATAPMVYYGVDMAQPVPIPTVPAPAGVDIDHGGHHTRGHSRQRSLSQPNMFVPGADMGSSVSTTASQDPATPTTSHDLVYPDANALAGHPAATLTGGMPLARSSSDGFAHAAAWGMPGLAPYRSADDVAVPWLGIGGGASQPPILGLQTAYHAYGGGREGTASTEMTEYSVPLSAHPSSAWGSAHGMWHGADTHSTSSSQSSPFALEHMAGLKADDAAA